MCWISQASHYQELNTVWMVAILSWVQLCRHADLTFKKTPVCKSLCISKTGHQHKYTTENLSSYCNTTLMAQADGGSMCETGQEVSQRSGLSLCAPLTGFSLRACRTEQITVKWQRQRSWQAGQKVSWMNSSALYFLLSNENDTVCLCALSSSVGLQI